MSSDIKQMTATIKQLGVRWYVTVAGQGRPFTKESGFDTPMAAAEWARKYAATCRVGIDIQYAVKA